MKFKSYKFCQIRKNIWCFKKFKDILFHKSKYALTIQYILLIQPDKSQIRQIIIFTSIKHKKESFGIPYGVSFSV